MVNVVIDTSLFIDFARTQTGALIKLIDQAASGKAQLLIPTIVIYEFWTGQSLDNPQVEKVATDIFQHHQAIPLSVTIAKLAGQLHRHQLATGIDAIIAATCLDQHAQLATLNRKHFSSIPQLQLWQTPTS